MTKGKPTESNRVARVGEQIRAELMDLLLRGAVHDPRARDVHVSDVDVTADLGLARVYVRVTGSGGDEAARHAVVDAMTRASGFLRRELGKRLRLRRVPELEFAWDDVVDDARRIESTLEQLRHDREAAGDSDDEA